MGVRVQLQPQNFLAPFSSQAPIPQKNFSLGQKISNLKRPLVYEHTTAYASVPSLVFT